MHFTISSARRLHKASDISLPCLKLSLRSVPFIFLVTAITIINTQYFLAAGLGNKLIIIIMWWPIYHRNHANPILNVFCLSYSRKFWYQMQECKGDLGLLVCCLLGASAGERFWISSWKVTPQQYFLSKKSKKEEPVPREREREREAAVMVEKCRHGLVLRVK